MSPSIHRSCRRARRLGFGLLLLALPACGLSDYEAKTLETQQRAERFDKEQKYLDEPVKMPTTPDKDGKEVPVADVFFRPPKGIGPKPSSLGNQLWRYARTGKSDFVRVEMAFATEAKDFAKDVMRAYQATENFQAPQRESFDTWEFNDAEYGYSVNVLKSNRTQVAVVYVFPKGQRDNLRPAMDLSLQSLAVARQKYRDKSPWRLKPAP